MNSPEINSNNLFGPSEEITEKRSEWKGVGSKENIDYTDPEIRAIRTIQATIGRFQAGQFTSPEFIPATSKLFLQAEREYSNYTGRIPLATNPKGQTLELSLHRGAWISPEGHPEQIDEKKSKVANLVLSVREPGQ